MKYKSVTEEAIKFIITRNLNELAELTRNHVAATLGINRAYLSEKFREDTHWTVLEFITFEKMKRAEHMLQTRPDLTVNDISLKVGIAKCKQFRSNFKKFFGLKPGKYREVTREIKN